MDVTKLITSNYFAKIEPLLDSNFHIEGDKIKRNVVIPTTQTPWILHLPEKMVMNCIKWHTILFPCFDVIPKECFNCYKVVVRPENVVELFKLQEIQASLPENIYCKCGTERERLFVESAYGGYFYNKLEGLEAGLDLLDAVRVMLDGRVKCQIYLKRACTEYENRFGPSNRWEYNPKEAEYSQWIDDNFHKNSFLNPRLPEEARKNVMAEWIKFAAYIGDLSYTELTNGMHIYGVPIKYERKSI